jgi:hypothetical protein
MTDAQGVRDNEAGSVEKPAGQICVFVLGD